MIRRTARWQTTIDERLLEHLRDAGETTVAMLGSRLDLPRGILRDRLRMCAQVELVAVERVDGEDWYDLTYWGQLYLQGEYDVRLYPQPDPDAGYRMRV